MCELSPPIIVSDREEFVLELHSVFNISCTGKRSVTWEEPLPADTHVLPGYYTAMLMIDSATAQHTGEYMCIYETSENEEPDNIASIYIFVPGKY